MKNIAFVLSTLTFLTSSIVLSQGKSTQLTQENKGLQLVASAGYGQRLGKIPDGVDNSIINYLKSLRRGFSIAAEGNYFFNDAWGIGLKYSLFATNKDFAASSTGPFFGDKIQINYVAPQVLMRNISANKKHLFLSNFGIGYATFKNESDVDQQDLIISGNNIAFNLDLGYELRINEYAAFVFRIGLLSGALSKIETEGELGTETIELEGDDRESLARLDFLGGFRIRL